MSSPLRSAEDLLAEFLPAVEDQVTDYLGKKINWRLKAHREDVEAQARLALWIAIQRIVETTVENPGGYIRTCIENCLMKFSKKVRRDARSKTNAIFEDTGLSDLALQPRDRRAVGNKHWLRPARLPKVGGEEFEERSACCGDSIDEQIVALLEEGTVETRQEIGERVGLRRAAVTERLESLRRKYVGRAEAPNPLVERIYGKPVRSTATSPRRRFRVAETAADELVYSVEQERGRGRPRYLARRSVRARECGYASCA